MTKKYKIFLFSSLYIYQFIPLSFYSEALPTFLRKEGFDVSIIGLIHLSILPWMLKFLWAPIVDKFQITKKGHYRGWIILMQILILLLLIINSFLNIHTNTAFIILFLIILSIFASTQDIAVDAYAINILKKNELSLGNGIQNSAHYIGSLIGGGLMLVALNYIGWQNSILILALLSLVPLTGIAYSKLNNERSINKESDRLKKSLSFFKEKQNQIWIGFLILVPFGNSMLSFIFKPFLVDNNYSLESIGLLKGVYGLSAGLAGAIISGIILKLSNRNFLFKLSILLLSLSVLFYLLPIYNASNIYLILITILTTKFTGGFFTTIIYTIAMEKSRKEVAGTDFSIQMAILALSSHGIGAPIGGLLYNLIGFEKIVFLGFCTTVSGLLLLKYLKNQEVSNNYANVSILVTEN